MSDEKCGQDHHAWDPGISSQIPGELLPLTSLFRPENISNSLAEIKELSNFSGIPLYDLAAFRPERLLAHEILIRVSADLTVPDGPNYEDLGMNMRGMVLRVLDKYIEPELPSLLDSFESLSTRTSDILKSEIDGARGGNIETVMPAKSKGLSIKSFFGGRKENEKSSIKHVDPDARALDIWTDRLRQAESPLVTACLTCLLDVGNIVIGTRGRLVGDDALASLAKIRVLNTYGSEFLGGLVRPLFQRACEGEGYRLLPAQKEPCIMNVKGASASGKSSMRSLQRQLAARIGVNWEDFALISPDYWRKFLLDYDSLGEHYKYAGALTGHELSIIDRKLDDYVRGKATVGNMGHLLIDRFRFDSFWPSGGGEADSKLLSRFGKTIYLFFMVTPPEATVDRAWTRGLSTGRYKAVDDLLYHNVEAYKGMPELFFSWAFAESKQIHFEFLDNSVPIDEKPTTIASGWNRQLTVFDIDGMLDIERYRKINIEASQPSEIYKNDGQDLAEHSGFLRQCLKRLDRVDFINPQTGKICAVHEGGQWTLTGDEGHMSEDVLKKLSLIDSKVVGAPRNGSACGDADGVTDLLFHNVGAAGFR